MDPFFSALIEGSDVYEVETRAGGFMLRPFAGRQVEFNRLAELVIDKSGEEFAVFPHIDGAAGWSSLMVFPLRDATA